MGMISCFLKIESSRSASNYQVHEGKKTHSRRWCDVLHIENKIGADGIGEITRIADPSCYVGFFFTNTKRCFVLRCCAYIIADFTHPVAPQQRQDISTIRGLAIKVCPTRVNLLHSSKYDLIRVLTIWDRGFLNIAAYEIVIDFFTRCCRNSGIEEVEVHVSKGN
jgi:hypothetical protein